MGCGCNPGRTMNIHAHVAVAAKGRGAGVDAYAPGNVSPPGHSYSLSERCTCTAAETAPRAVGKTTKKLSASPSTSLPP